MGLWSRSRMCFKSSMNLSNSLALRSATKKKVFMHQVCLLKKLKQYMHASTGMSCGTLHVRYLGVPLNSKKLNLANCEPLIHQIKSRLSSWSVKSLSFSGRLLLIKTVIAGITPFWCSAFILQEWLGKQ